jgi:uncharacterized protein
VTTALVVVGGWAHLGYEPTVVDDPAHAVAPVVAGVDLVVVHTCRFLMLDARYTEAQRAEFRYHTPEPVRAALVSHVAAGRPLLALHTAPLCFDDWPEWAGLVGARWDWERSNHPPPGEFVVRPTDHPVVAGLEPFTVIDELYRFVEPAAGAEVVATAVDAEGVTHPTAWLQHAGPARVAYDSLGHDERSLRNEAHRALLARLLAWLHEAN